MINRKLDNVFYIVRYLLPLTVTTNPINLIQDLWA